MPLDPACDVAAAPFVSVVIPHFNDLAHLRLCLEALAGQSWPAERFEIVVADNNSACGIAAVEALAAGTAARDHVRVVAAPIQGAGPARNAAASVARGEVLAFIDSDCRASREWLRAGVEALRRFDYAGGAVKTIVDDPGTMTAAQAYEAEFAFNFQKYIEVDKFSGTGNLFMRRAIFRAVGPFRAGVSEDVEWCQRANAAGYRIGYAPDAIVAHAARDDWRGLKAKWRRVIGESHLLAVERPGGRARFLLRACAVGLSPIAHTPRVVVSKRLAGVRQKALGLAGLYGIRLYRAGAMVRLALFS